MREVIFSLAERQDGIVVVILFSPRRSPGIVAISGPVPRDHTILFLKTERCLIDSLQRTRSAVAAF